MYNDLEIQGNSSKLIPNVGMDILRGLHILEPESIHNGTDKDGELFSGKVTKCIHKRFCDIQFEEMFYCRSFPKVIGYHTLRDFYYQQWDHFDDNEMVTLVYFEEQEAPDEGVHHSDHEET